MCKRDDPTYRMLGRMSRRERKAYKAREREVPWRVYVDETLKILREKLKSLPFSLDRDSEYLFRKPQRTVLS